MALAGRVPGLGNIYVIPGRYPSILGLSLAAGFRRSRRLLLEPGFGTALVGGRRAFPASQPWFEVPADRFQRAGVRSIPVPGVFITTGARSLAAIRRPWDRVQR